MPSKKSQSNTDAHLPKREHTKHQDDANPNAPALVRINPARGYVKGNVTVVSQRAETQIEHFRDENATPAELRVLAYILDLAADQPYPKALTPRRATLIAHARKTDATPAELRLLADWIEHTAAEQHA